MVKKDKNEEYSIYKVQQSAWKAIENDKERTVIALALRQDLKKYICFISPFIFNKGFTFMPFHDEVIQALQDIADQKNTRPNLMLNLPVGSGKSTMVELFITWCFARDKNINFLYTSHSGRLIEKLSKETRNIIKSDIYCKLFDVKLKKDDSAKINFSFEDASEKAGLVAGSMGTGLTGFDAGNPHIDGFPGALIIDDFLDASNIRSQSARDECVNLYNEKLKTRRRRP